MSDDHDQMTELLHAYVDGELDLAGSREVEQHLHSCEECRRSEEQIRTLHLALTNEAPAYRAPAHLRKNVRAALRRTAKSQREISWPWLAFAASTACAIVFAGWRFFKLTGHQAMTLPIKSSRIIFALSSPLICSMWPHPISTRSSLGFMVRSILPLRFATYRRKAFPWSAAGSIISLAKRPLRLSINETNTLSISSLLPRPKIATALPSLSLAGVIIFFIGRKAKWNIGRCPT